MSRNALHGRQFAKILLIKLSAVGDVVHTIPVLNALRRRFPDARLDWLVTPAIGELLRHHPAITNVIDFTRELRPGPLGLPALHNLSRYAALAARLREARYDLVVDMHGQLRTAVLVLASGAPVRIGFDRPRRRVWAQTTRQFPVAARKHAWKGAREGSWLAYTHAIPVTTLEKHAVDRYLGLGALLGLDQRPADFSFPLPPHARARVAQLLADHRIAGTGLVVLAPGTVWETKQWQSEGFAAVARHYLQKGLAVVLIGSARERAVCGAVATQAPGVVDLSGVTTLSEVAALIARATICLTNDSGPMHLAVALERKVVSIFGPTDPIWVGPYQRDGAVQRAALACSPCYLRQLSRCAHDHACMKAVSAAAVIARMEQMLSSAALDAPASAL